MLEGEVEGEKRDTFLSKRASAARGLDGLEQRLDRVERKLDGLDLRFSAFLREFPGDS